MRSRARAVFLGLVTDVGVCLAGGVVIALADLVYEVQQIGLQTWLAKTRIGSPVAAVLLANFVWAICAHMIGGFTSVKQDPQHRLSSAVMFGVARLGFGAMFHVFHPQYFASATHILSTLLVVPASWFGGRQFTVDPHRQADPKTKAETDSPPIALP